MPKKKPTKVYRYDGQGIWTSSDSGYASYSDYELGSFLGGGAAGVVYEAECFKTKRHLAVKVLNPVGYKLAPSGSLRFCEVIVKGQPYGDVGAGLGGRGSSSKGGGGGHGGPGSVSGGGNGSSGGGGAGKMSEKHVWWLVNRSTRQTIAAYHDVRTGMLKEMTLPKCIEVWGLGDDKGRRAGVRGAGRRRERERERMKQEDRVSRVFVGGEWLTIPSAPAKYDKFLRARASIFREISNMLQLTEHPNILRLHDALELVQDSKATIFLVLELARGGELFDRIKVDCGADEGAARHYFRQLLSGVQHCHDRGVCHRDLKPENLLLADPHDSSVLKIADFGFSALFRELESESSSGEDSSGPSPGSGSGRVSGVGMVGGIGMRQTPPSGSLSGRTRVGARGGARGGAGAGGVGGGSKGRGVRRLKSVVGSPYYVAPEVLREESGYGYDGTKADVWSMGVILYAMLAGNLPFEKELLTCPRFAKFGAWARMPSATASLLAHCSGNPKDAMDMDCLDYPSWFFPQHFSFAAKSLLSGLLHPDASSRLSVRQALRHPWVLDGKLCSDFGGSSSDGSEFSVGGGGVEDGPRAPDPQDIPSELLGADSDTEEEEPPPPPPQQQQQQQQHQRQQQRQRQQEDRRDGSREWNEGSDKGSRRVGSNRPATKAPSLPPPPPPSPTVPSTTLRKKSNRGSVGGTKGGGGDVLVTRSTSGSLSKEVPPPAIETASKLGGVTKRDVVVSGTALDGAVRASEVQRGAVSAAGDGGYEASQPRPAPPPPPPPPVAAAPTSSSVPSGPSTSPTETKESKVRRGLKGAVGDDVGILQTRLIRELSVGEGEGQGEGERLVAGRKVGVAGTKHQDGRALPGLGAATEVEAAVTAKAGKEELAVLEETAAAAAAAAATPEKVAVVTVSKVAGMTSQSSTPLPAPPPLAPVDATEQFVTPRKSRSPRPLDVFSSPPLAPVGSERTVEEGVSDFSLDGSRPVLPAETGHARSREGLPPSGAGRAKSRRENSSVAFPHGRIERQLSMGVAGISIVEAEAAGKREGVVATAPPAFHDLVKRSTRFMTSVPAAVVLRKIATIIDADAHPLPYPYRNIKQKAVVHQDDYKLEIMRGGVLVCTVQIYLLGGEQRAAQYMVEFLRGQLDIFLFKRFYEDVRCKLNDLVKKDYSLALLESGACTHRLRRFTNLA